MVTWQSPYWLVQEINNRWTKFWYTETRGPLAAAVTPLSFYWLSHFPAPQPLHLVAPPPSALTSFIHFALTFCRTLLVRLVFALPGASPPPSRRDSARCRLSSHPPHLVVVCHIARRLGLSYGWLSWCLLSHRCLLCVYASRLWQHSASSAAAPAAMSVLYNVSRTGAGPPRTPPFPLSLRRTSVASAGPPPPLPSPRLPLCVSITSVGPLLTITLSLAMAVGTIKIDRNNQKCQKISGNFDCHRIRR